MATPEHQSGTGPPIRRTTHRCSLQCVIPPHLLDAIVRQGPPLQRQFALDTLNVDHSFRAIRVGILAERRARRGLLVERGVRRLAGAVAPEPQRAIYDANNTQRLPGSLVRSEGQGPTADPAVDEAYDGLGATWDLYWEQYGRNSLDGAGMRLDATVHFGQDYENAFWDGRRMVFGDGDGVVFDRFTRSIDVVGHELTHGVIEHEAGLIYWDQPGALNESLADVFGSLVKQYHLGQTAAAADWLIGQELFVPGAVLGVALRSLKAPGTAYGHPVPDPLLGVDPQPAHMDDYVRTLSDNRGVHINSGIPNHAFYRVATKLGGYAWERAGLIWYGTLQSPFLRRVTGFRSFARLTIGVAARLFGAGSAEQQAVREGWTEVGLDV